jgi:hypothetical protein
VYENRVLRRVFGPKKEEVPGNRENYIMRSFKILTVHQMFLRRMRKAGQAECVRRMRQLDRPKQRWTGWILRK